MTFLLVLLLLFTGVGKQMNCRAQQLPESIAGETDVGADRDISEEKGEDPDAETNWDVTTETEDTVKLDAWQAEAYTTVKHLLSAGANAATKDGKAAYSNIQDSDVTIAAIQAKGGHYAKCIPETRKKVEIDKEYYYKLTYENMVGTFMTKGFTDNRGQHHGACHLVEKFYKQHQVYSQVYSYSVTNHSTKTIDYYYFIYIWRELIDEDYHETSAKDILTYCVQYGEPVSKNSPAYAKEKSSYDSLSTDEKYRVACAIYYGPHRNKDGTYYRSLETGMSSGVIGYDPGTWSAAFWKKYIATQLYIWTITNPGKFSYSDALKTARLLDEDYSTTDADHCESFLKDIHSYVENATKIPSFMKTDQKNAITQKLAKQSDGTFRLVLNDSYGMLKTGSLTCDDENLTIKVNSVKQVTLSSEKEISDAILSFQKNEQVPDGSGLLYYANEKSQNMVNSVVSTQNCYGYAKLSTIGVDEICLSIHKISDPSNQNEVHNIAGTGFAVYTTYKSAAVYDPVTKKTMVDSEGNAIKAEDYVAGYLYRPSSGIWKMIPYTDENLQWITENGYSYHIAYHIAYYVKQGHTSDRLPGTYCILTDSKGYAYTDTLKMCQRDGDAVNYCSYYLLEYDVPEPYELFSPVTIEGGKVTAGQIAAKWNEGEMGYANPEQCVTNNSKEGSIRIYKYEDGSLTPLSGVTFEIFHDAACTQLFRRVVTDETGIALAEHVTWGTYYVREQEGQPVHVKDTGISEVKVDAGRMSIVDKSNIPIVLCFHLQKQVNMDNLPADFDSTMYSVAGAEYALYAREAVMGSNNQVLYEADEYICTMVCDAEGIASVDMEFAKRNLRLGKYYLKETKAPYGFLLDEKIYEIDATDPESVSTWEAPEADEYQKDQSMLNVWINIEAELLELNSIHIYKSADHAKGKGTISLEGAIFSVYNVSRMEQDGIHVSESEFAYFDFINKKYDKYRMVINGDNNNKYTMSTNAQGTAETLKLPDGTYSVVEVRAPTGYERAENQRVILPDDARAGMAYLSVVDKRKQGYIEVIKSAEVPDVVKYTETKYGMVAQLDYKAKHQSGIRFQIYDEDLQEVDIMVTDKNGTAKSGMLPVGVYYVKEVATFAGLVLDSQMHRIEIKAETDEKIPVERLALTNALMTTELSIYKTGEAVKVSKKKEFDFVKLPLEGVVFGIYNKEEILNGDGNVLLPAGQLMGVAVSDENGEAVLLEKLLPGTYYYQELQPLEGYMPDKTRHEFTLSLLSNAPVERVEINKKSPLLNRYYKAAVRLRKVDGTNHSIRLAGVEFELYDATTNELIGVYTTDEKGEIYIEQMPYGSWYFKEKKALAGYEIDLNPYAFEISNDGRNVEILVENQPNIKLGHEDKTNIKWFRYVAVVSGIGLLVFLEGVLRRRRKK